MDSDRDISPFVTDKDGKPLRRIRCKDARVRKALSKVINRPAIVERVMEGEAIPAGQLVPDFLFGATRSSRSKPFDPEGAKKLLAEAGYPDGFGLTHPRAEQPLRQRRADRAGGRADADARRHRDQGRGDAVGVSSPAGTDLKFSFMLLGLEHGHRRSVVVAEGAADDVQQRQGLGHREPRPLLEHEGRRAGGRAATVDDAKRESYLQRAAELAINDTGSSRCTSR